MWVSLSHCSQLWRRLPNIHHEIGEVLFFLDIFGKVTSKIVGLYSETKLDKVVYKHEQIGIEGQDIARGP
jgi:hypothetical protein